MIKGIKLKENYKFLILLYKIRINIRQKTEDYKISAVKYYLNNDRGDGYNKTCKIFDCKKYTLRDWIKYDIYSIYDILININQHV